MIFADFCLYCFQFCIFACNFAYSALFTSQVRDLCNILMFQNSTKTNEQFRLYMAHWVFDATLSICYALHPGSLGKQLRKATVQSWDSWPLGNLTIPRLQEAVFFRPPDLKQAASSCVLTVSCGMAKSFSCAASKNAQKSERNIWRFPMLTHVCFGDHASPWHHWLKYWTAWTPQVTTQARLALPKWSGF